MPIREYAGVWARRKWTIALVLIGTVAVVAVGSYAMTPVYSSTTMVRIAPTQSGAMDYYWGAKGAERLMNTYVHLLRSRPFLNEAIRRLDLDVTPEDLAKALKVEATVNSELLTITAKDADPWVSAAIANTLGLLLVEEGQKLYSGPGKSTQEILQEQLARVETDLRQQRASLQALLDSKEGRSDFGTIEDLGRKIEIEEKTYTMLLDEYESARLREAMLASTISVVEWALPPDKPSQPRTTLNLAVGALAGLIGGTGLAFLFEHLDRRIYSTENLEAATSVPVLGSVPIFGVPRRSRGEIALLAGDMHWPASEAFRVLRSIVLSGAEGSYPRTLLIASAEPGAGKSTVLVNLATVMAQAGRSVIVVDSDLRHPCLHRVFELPNNLGLSTVLVNLETVMAQAGRKVIVVDGDSRHPSLPGAFQLRNSVGPSNVLLEGGSLSTALRGTKVPGVRVLTSGPLPHYPAELLGSAGMQKVVTALSNSADVVLFDSPPMLAVADAVDLASMVEGVLLVAARGKATGEQLQTVLQQLDRVGARVLGIILNKARLGDESYGYYYDHLMTDRKQFERINDARQRPRHRDRPVAHRPADQDSRSGMTAQGDQGVGRSVREKRVQRTGNTSG